MYLVRNVMDKEIVDRYGFKAGKVNDLLLDLSSGNRPAVRSVITGHDSLARHLGPRLHRIVGWLAYSVLGLPRDLTPVRLEWRRVTAIDVVVHMDIDREDAGVMQAETFMWEHWVSRLPFSRR